MEDLFQELDIPERVAMLEGAEQKVFNDGEMVLAEDLRNDDIYAIVEGEVRVVVGSGEKAIEVARLSAGTFFGEMSFLSHATTSASIIAAGKVEIMCVTQKNILGMIEKDPGFAGRFYRSLACTLAERLRRSNQRS